LVVEDTDDIRFFLSKLLQDRYQVISAASGTDGLRLAALAPRPDLILLDVLMPDMDGYAACRLLGNESATKDIPVVFVTSKKQKADRLWAQMQGGKAYVTKPYSADAIIDQLKAFL
jgi:twitching motility two-component system response regulator PilH